MILQALVKAYEALAERGELEKPGRFRPTARRS